MKNRLLSAIALIGLMLFSTLGSLAFSPSLPTTKTEYGVTVKAGKTTVPYADVVFLVPAEQWRSPEPIRYQRPGSDGKYDNRPINGILNQEDRKKGKKLTE